MVYRASLLSSEALVSFIAHSSLIVPSTLPLIKQPSSFGYWIAVEAVLDEALLGLCLVEVTEFPFHKEAKIQSLVVAPAWRGLGLGKALFAFTESFCRNSNEFSCIEFFYCAEDPFAPLMERIARSLGWPASFTCLISCVVDIFSFNPSWLSFPFQLPRDAQCLTWDFLTARDKHDIELFVSQGHIPHYLNPLSSKERIEASTTFFLRYRKQIVGWSATRQEGEESLEYFSLFVSPLFSRSGIGIKLLTESILSQKKLPFRFALFDINPSEIDPSWAFFVKKRLLPFAVSIQHRKRAFCCL